MVGCAVKLGDGPFSPLILLAIAGPVPKNTVMEANCRRSSIVSAFRRMVLMAMNDA